MEVEEKPGPERQQAQRLPLSIGDPDQGWQHPLDVQLLCAGGQIDQARPVQRRLGEATVGLLDEFRPEAFDGKPVAPDEVNELFLASLGRRPNQPSKWSRGATRRAVAPAGKSVWRGGDGR